MAGEWVQVEGSQYQDLGQVLTAGAIAAGATVFGTTWYTGLQWVRNIEALAQIDQAWALVANKGDSTTQPGYTTTLGTSSSVTTADWAPLNVTQILGYQARFGLKNTAASATTVANLRIQLLGQ